MTTFLRLRAAAFDTDLLLIAGAVLLGLVLVFAGGMSGASVLHDAAHDSRHANVFPCH